MKKPTITRSIAFSFLSLAAGLSSADDKQQVPGEGGVLLDISSIVVPATPAATATVDEAGVAVKIETDPAKPDDTEIAAEAKEAVTAPAAQAAANKAKLPAPAETAEETPAAEQGVPVEIPTEMPVVEEVSASGSAPADSVKENAADADDADSGFRAIVDAMRPKGQVDPLQGDRLTLYFSEKVISPQFERNAERIGLDKARMQLGFLVSEERDSVLQGGLSVDSEFASSLRLSFGTRAYIALLGIENTDTFATAFGVEAAYKLPFKALPLDFGASFYYAPDILTFGSGDRVIDTQVGVSLPFRSQLALFGGIRYLQVDTRPEDREIDNRAHLGLRWDFD
jgi:hypothetical protein